MTGSGSLARPHSRVPQAALISAAAFPPARLWRQAGIRVPSEARARPQTRISCLFAEPRGGRARFLTCRVPVPGVAAPPRSSRPAQLCIRTHEKSLVTHCSQLGTRLSQQKNCFRKQQKGHVNP